MTPLTPIFFWSFLSLIPLLAIYFLKVRPRQKQTSAYFLWEKVFSAKKATSLFQRLRDLFSLLLMALAFAAVCLALTNLEFAADERKDLLIVIDQSASMQARDGRETRLDQAKAAASEIILGITDTQRAAVASIGREVTFHSHLSNHPPELLESIKGIEATDFPFQASALSAILQGEEWADSYRVLFFTDGSFEKPADFPKALEVVRVGDEKAENLGVTAADLQRIPGGPGRVGFFFRIASTFEKTVETDLILQHRESSRIYKLIPLKLEPGENPAQTFTIDDAPAGHWTATLDLEDAFGTDNVAFLSLTERESIPVAVEGSDEFLASSVLAFQQSDGLLSLADDGTGATIVLARKRISVEPEQAVVIQPDGESPFWLELEGEFEEVIVPKVLIEDHPILRFLDPQSINFDGARKLRAPDGSLILVETDFGVPLIYLARTDGRAALVLNMDPMKSSFYLSAAFPVMIHSAATYLVGRSDPLLATYQPGSFVPVPGAEENTEFFVSAPGSDGVVQERVGKEFGPVSKVGFYEYRAGDSDWSSGSSLADLGETLLGGAGLETNLQPIAKGRAPAFWLILLAILIVVGESLLYHRRKVG